MDSSESDSKALSSSTAASPPNPSLSVSESQLFDYLSNLSPIKSVKATPCTPRLSETHFPTPSIFTTPRLDLQRETSFLKSYNMHEAGSDVHGKCGNRANAILVPFLEKEVQSCSPSGCVEEYLTDPVENCTNSAGSHVRQANNFSFNVPKEAILKVNDENSEDCMFMLPDQAKEVLPLSSMDLVETTVHERNAVRFYRSLELTSKNVSDQEAALQQRHTRRYLQFEAAMTCKSTATLKSNSSYNEIEEAGNLKIPASVANLESLIPSHIQPRGFSNHRQKLSTEQTITSWTSFCPSKFINSTQHGGTLAISGPIPSGTDLHINSISSSVPMGSDMILRKKLAGYTSSQEEKKLTLGYCNTLANSLNSCFVSSAAGGLHTHVDDNQQDAQGVEEISSDIFQSTDNMKPPCNYLHATLSEQQVVPSQGGMHTSESIDRAEELNQMNPKKKGKRASSENDGCKHCNCRRSKCLKLYCDCFAAGVYCVDSCACKSCHNKLEYEDTVSDMRKQIKSRNPLAFAPKIVKHAPDSPANILDDGNWTTPASARHKRGCNCKKSKCLKKYCECYQAKVGCSDACRCEGCNNSFGKKAESMYQRAERWKNPSHCKLDSPTETDTDGTKGGTVTEFSPRKEFADISNLTPLSHSYSGPVALSVSPISQAQLHSGSSLKSPASQLRWRFSSMSVAPHLFEKKDAHELSAENAFTEIRKNDETPEVQKNTCTPTTPIKAHSPNKKQASPPPSPGLRSGRKFVWQDVPSFPPLTPYSKPKEGNPSDQ